MGESDIAEVSQLLQQALVADGHYPLGEHKWLDLVHGGRKGFAGFVAREPSNGPLVGYAQLSRGHDTWGVEVVIRPDHRKPDAEVGVSLLSRGVARSCPRRRRARPPVGPQAHPPHRRHGRELRPAPGARPLPDATAPSRRGRPSPRLHPALPARPGRKGVARGQQPGLRLASRAGGLEPRHHLRARGRGLVRPRRLSPPRARRALGRIVLDEGAPRHRAAARRDLRDLGGPRLPGTGPGPRPRAGRPRPPVGSRASPWGCSTSTPTTPPPCTCTGSSASRSTTPTGPMSPTWRPRPEFPPLWHFSIEDQLVPQ